MKITIRRDVAKKLTAVLNALPAEQRDADLVNLARSLDTKARAESRFLTADELLAVIQFVEGTSDVRGDCYRHGRAALPKLRAMRDAQMARAAGQARDDDDADTTPIQYGPPHGGW